MRWHSTHSPDHKRGDRYAELDAMIFEPRGPEPRKPGGSSSKDEVLVAVAVATNTKSVIAANNTGAGAPLHAVGIRARVAMMSSAATIGEWPLARPPIDVAITHVRHASACVVENCGAGKKGRW
jgi:hypothetical protein